MSLQKKKYNIDKYMICTQKGCQGQRVMKKLNEAESHWGHDFKKLPDIQSMVRSQETEERFQKMRSHSQIIQKIQKYFSDLLEEITMFLAFKKNEIEKKIQSTPDPAIHSRQLYNELKKDYLEINMDYVSRNHRGWNQLLDSTQDSEALFLLESELEVELNEFKTNLRRYFRIANQERHQFRDNQTKIQQIEGSNEISLIQKISTDVSEIKINIDKYEEGPTEVKCGVVNENFQLNPHEKVIGSLKKLNSIRAPEVVVSVAITNDGSVIASRGCFGTLDLWDTITGDHIKKLEGHNTKSDTCYSYPIVFTPDSKKLISGGENEPILIWDVEKRIKIGETNTKDNTYIRDIAIRPPEHEQFVSIGEGNIILYNIESRKEIGRFIEKKQGGYYACSFSYDGKILATGGYSDNTIKIWNSESRVVKETLKGHSNWVWRIIFFKDNQSIISASWDSTIKFWNLQNGSCTRTINQHTDEVYGIILLRNQEILASVSKDQTLRFWDLTKEGQEIEQSIKYQSPIRGLCVSSDEKIIITGSCDKKITRYDISNFMKQKPILGGYLLAQNGSKQFLFKITQAYYSHDSNETMQKIDFNKQLSLKFKQNRVEYQNDKGDSFGQEITQQFSNFYLSGKNVKIQIQQSN